MIGQVVTMFSPQLVRPGVWVGFTGVETGNLAFHVGDDPTAVALRRAALNQTLSKTVGTEVSLAYMNQVHGNEVANIRAGADAPTADAMVTQPKDGLGLAVMVADCVPVVFVGDKPDGGVLLAVAHAGRPGVELDVVSETVARLRQGGAGAIEAWLGPSICGRCYEVPAQMREDVARRVPEAYATTSWGTPALDLPAAVVAQLRSNQVTAHPSGDCTFENAGFHSHRRAVRDATAEGRFIGFAVSSL